jgi:hypothetical protein
MTSYAVRLQLGGASLAARKPPLSLGAVLSMPSAHCRLVPCSEWANRTETGPRAGINAPQVLRRRTTRVRRKESWRGRDSREGIAAVVGNRSSSTRNACGGKSSPSLAAVVGASIIIARISGTLRLPCRCYGRRLDPAHPPPGRVRSKPWPRCRGFFLRERPHSRRFKQRHQAIVSSEQVQGAHNRVHQI